MAPDHDPTSYEDFLLTEYSNISQAHFKSIETISNFFRYYLLLMSVPITVIGILYRMADGGNANSANIIGPNQSLFSMALLVISLVGLGVSIYVINLRLDVVLYARTVNSIRKHFYNKSELDNDQKLRFKVFPQSPSLPPYREKSYFLPVIFVFALLNTSYFFLSLRECPFVWEIIKSKAFVSQLPLISIHPLSIMGIICALFFVLHFFAYFMLARHRETGYLRSNIVGVDIDGVLNMHKEHFCKLLKSF